MAIEGLSVLEFYQLSLDQHLQTGRRQNEPWACLERPPKGIKEAVLCQTDRLVRVVISPSYTTLLTDQARRPQLTEGGSGSLRNHKDVVLVNEAFRVSAELTLRSSCFRDGMVATVVLVTCNASFDLPKHLFQASQAYDHLRFWIDFMQFALEGQAV